MGSNINTYIHMLIGTHNNNKNNDANHLRYIRVGGGA